MRLFTAFEFPPDVKAELARVQHALKPLVTCRRWQSLRQAHLTLDFIGEVPAPLLAPLQEMLARTAAVHAPFELSLGGFGGFPSLARARVLWIGVEGERDRLEALEHDMRLGLAATGAAVEDRPYSPHITLAREPVKSPVLTELPARIQVAPLAWRAETVVLFNSELRPEGAVHTELGRYDLTGTR
jgi:2'-5' RNA ligase